jgi:hypothetical protein
MLIRSVNDMSVTSDMTSLFGEYSKSPLLAFLKYSIRCCPHAQAQVPTAPLSASSNSAF